MNTSLINTQEENNVVLSKGTLSRKSRMAENLVNAFKGLNNSFSEAPGAMKNYSFDFNGEGDFSGNQSLSTYMKSLSEAKSCNTPLERACQTTLEIFDANPCGGVFVEAGVDITFSSTNSKHIVVSPNADSWVSATDCEPVVYSDAPSLLTTSVDISLDRNVWKKDICSLDANGLGWDLEDVARTMAQLYVKDEIALQDRLLLNQIFNSPTNAAIPFHGPAVTTNMPLNTTLGEMVTKIKMNGGNPVVFMDYGAYDRLRNEQDQDGAFSNRYCCTPNLALPKSPNDCTSQYLGQFNYGSGMGTAIYAIPQLMSGLVAGDPEGASTAWGPASGGGLSSFVVLDLNALRLVYGDRTYNNYDLFYRDRQGYDTGCISARGTVLASAVVTQPDLICYYVLP